MAMRISTNVSARNTLRQLSGTGVYSATLSGVAAGDYTIGDGSSSGEVTVTSGLSYRLSRVSVTVRRTSRSTRSA